MDIVKQTEDKILKVRNYLNCFDKELLPDEVIKQSLEVRSVGETVGYLSVVMAGPKC